MLAFRDKLRGLALLWVLLATPVWAATERYDYDPLGRLVRYTNAQGQVTEYVYDAAGNILAVKGGGAAIPPAITGVTPNFIRRSQRNPVRLTGTGLAGSTVRSVDPTLFISGVVTASSTIDFDVDVPSTAALGLRTFEVSHSGGLASTSLQVVSAIALGVVPSPIAVPADGVGRRYKLDVSDSYPFALSFELSAVDPLVLGVAPIVVLPGGATQTDVVVSGLATGSTQLLVAPVGGDVVKAVPAFVGSDAANANVAYSLPVGISRNDPLTIPPGTPLSAYSIAVGLVKQTNAIPIPGGTALDAYSPAVGIVKAD